MSLKQSPKKQSLKELTLAKEKKEPAQNRGSPSRSPSKSPPKALRKKLAVQSKPQDLILANLGDANRDKAEIDSRFERITDLTE
jgi:hypothetical protein